MKIAHLAPATIAFPVKGDKGRWHLVSSLIRAQIKAGHKITIFSNQKTRFPGAKLISVPPLWKDVPKNSKEIILWKKYATLLLLEKAYSMADKFDIIHSHLNERHLFFAPLVKTPTIITQHWPLDKPTLEIYKNINQKNIWTVPISNSQKKQGRGIVKYTKTVYNGINMSKFKYHPNPKDYFVFLGRLHPDKGAHLAIEAAKKMKVDLFIAGATQPKKPIYKKYWDKFIYPHLKNPNITYLGELDHNKVHNLLKNARALVFPIQWEEPFGLVMIEAMASGTPVISFNKGSVPELVKNKKTGFVIKQKSQLIPAMKKIDQIKRIDCRKWVEKKFSVKAMVSNYETLYKNIIKKNN